MASTSFRAALYSSPFNTIARQSLAILLLAFLKAWIPPASLIRAWLLGLWSARFLRALPTSSDPVPKREIKRGMAPAAAIWFLRSTFPAKFPSEEAS